MMNAFKVGFSLRKLNFLVYYRRESQLNIKTKNVFCSSKVFSSSERVASWIGSQKYFVKQKTTVATKNLEGCQTLNILMTCDAQFESGIRQPDWYFHFIRELYIEKNKDQILQGVVQG